MTEKRQEEFNKDELDNGNDSERRFADRLGTLLVTATSFQYLS